MKGNLGMFSKRERGMVMLTRSAMEEGLEGPSTVGFSISLSLSLSLGLSFWRVEERAEPVKYEGR